MKAKSITSLFVCLLGFSAFTSSCEDMLTPDITIGSDGHRTIADTVNNYLGIMRCVQQVAEQTVILGEARGDLVSTTSYTSDSIDRIANFKNPVDGENNLLNRAGYYKVINHCNYYLAHVDSIKTLNYNYLMKKEVAQVILTRAWAYMMLVQNYGRVPYITVPVESAGTGWETNPAEGWVSLAAGEENLLNRLMSTGLLEQACAYEKLHGLPAYGTYNNGAVQMQSTLTMFPSDVIMGELYLLCAQTKADYEKAAQHFYNYLSDEKICVGTIRSGRAIFTESRNNGVSTYNLYSSDWAPYLKAGNYKDVSSGGVITYVPSAASSNFGLVLKRIPEIYGFKVSSTTSTITVEESDPSKDYVSTSGNVAVQGADYRLRQLQPSEGYVKLNESQPYAMFDSYATDAKAVTYPKEAHDARLDASAPYVHPMDIDGRMRFIHKFCMGYVDTKGESGGGYSFRYSIPLYTIPQIYLHFAEAINRAGFPRYAFTILSHGLNAQYMPTGILYKHVYTDVENHAIYLEPIIDSVVVPADDKGANHITPYEFAEAEGKDWLKFSDEGIWKNMYGIHELGCGYSSQQNVRYTYDNVVEERIAQEASRSGLNLAAARKYARRMMDEDSGDDTTTPSDDDTATVWTLHQLPIKAPSAEALAAQINAVETLIADELALQCAFEGFRYYDLMRMARHKNLDTNFTANYGSVWMAWLIARRDLNLNPYESPANKGNTTIFNLLSQGENGWYLSSPY